MTEDKKSDDDQKPCRAGKKSCDNDTLKTFDMYRCFSRIDVILAILLVVGLLVMALYYFYFSATPA